MSFAFRPAAQQHGVHGPQWFLTGLGVEPNGTIAASAYTQVYGQQGPQAAGLALVSANGGTYTLKTGLFPGRSTNSEQIGDLAVQPDGKILVAAGYHDDNGQILAGGVAGFLPNGTLDGSFGSGGMALAHSSYYDEFDAVKLDGQGRIYLAGSTGDQASRRPGKRLRLETDRAAAALRIRRQVLRRQRGGANTL